MKATDTPKLFQNEILYTHGKAGIYMCVRGTAKLLVNGQMFIFCRGTVSAVSPLIHIQILSQSDDCEFMVITEDIEHIFPVGRKFIDIIMDMRNRNDVVFLSDETFVDFVIRRKCQIDERRKMACMTENEREKQLCMTMVYLLTQELLLEVLALAYRRIEVKPVDVDRNTAMTFQFILSLYKNPTHCRQVAFYAEEAGLSVGHFTRVVRGSSGRTPTEWIAFITMAMAKNLLDNSKMSIKEIAAELNFPEQFTFRKYFKQHAGIPPKEYRRLQYSMSDTGE